MNKPAYIPTLMILILGASLLTSCTKEDSADTAQTTTQTPAEITDESSTHTATEAEQAAEEVFEEVLSNPLTETRWRLVELQSMSDETGTTESHDPSLYTMELNGDGTVQMVLNCNRANGTWTATPGEFGDSGSFEFGPLAVTKVHCPSPSLDQVIGTQAAAVRSFLLKGGKLYLSLMADGGTFVWEPNIVAGISTGTDTATNTETDTNVEIDSE